MLAAQICLVGKRDIFADFRDFWGCGILYYFGKEQKLPAFGQDSQADKT
jgi:hypothetical protein